jgi:hypothetical protein
MWRFCAAVIRRSIRMEETGGHMGLTKDPETFSLLR